MVPGEHALYGVGRVALVQRSHEAPVIDARAHALAGNGGGKVIVLARLRVADVDRNALLVHAVLIIAVGQAELCVGRIVDLLDFVFGQTEAELQTAVGREQVIEEGKYGGQILFGHLLGDDVGVADVAVLIHRVWLLILDGVGAVNVIDRLIRAHHHDVLGVRHIRGFEQVAGFGSAADEHANLARMGSGGVDRIRLVCGALRKLLVEPAFAVPVVQTFDVGAHGFGIAAEARVAVGREVPERCAAAECREQRAVLVITLVENRGAVAVRDAEIGLRLGEDLEHPFPVGNVDRAGAVPCRVDFKVSRFQILVVPAREHDVVMPAGFILGPRERSTGRGVYAILCDPVAAVHPAHEVVQRFLGNGGDRKDALLAVYVGIQELLALGMPFKRRLVVRHVFVYVIGQIVDHVVLQQLRRARRGTAHVHDHRIILGGKERVEVVELRAGDRNLETEFDLPTVKLHRFEVFHDRVLLIGIVIGRVLADRDPPRQLQRFALCAAVVGRFAAAEQQQRRKQHQSTQCQGNSFFHRRSPWYEFDRMIGCFVIGSLCTHRRRAGAASRSVCRFRARPLHCPAFRCPARQISACPTGSSQRCQRPEPDRNNSCRNGRCR